MSEIIQSPYIHAKFRYSTEIFQRSFLLFLYMLTLLKSDGLFPPNTTCYMGLQSCKSMVCLDWREVCNGIRNCEDGEDETQCLSIEMNSCNAESEYRCRNGMCVDRAFAFDHTFDCLDKSDEVETNIKSHIQNLNCFRNPSVQCEEFMCAWLSFSCSDGTCVKTSLGTCESGRMLVLNHRMFKIRNHTDIETPCFKLMLQIMRYEGICRINKIRDGCFRECYTDECSRTIEQICPPYFSFPPWPLLTHSILLVYDAEWTYHRQVFMPDYVCYENEHTCPQYPPTITLLVDNHLRRHCRPIKQYPDIKQTAEFDFLLAKLEQVLSACYPQVNPSPLLFLCKTSQQYLSVHRVHDGFFDCIDGQDELNNTACPVEIIPDRLNCGPLASCVHRRNSINNGFCATRMPELTVLSCVTSTDLGCRFMRGLDIPEHWLLFQEICNGIVHSNWINSSETDETDCLEHQRNCDPTRDRCNRIWKCSNGEDEINCRQSPCLVDGHSCYDIITKKQICLHISRADDGVVDCLGASDERLSHCPIFYPLEPQRRFRCLNDTLCIPIHDVCDGRSDCPLGDDEWPCPWRATSICPNDTFACKDMKLCLTDNARCNSILGCGNDLFCDLIPRRVYEVAIFNGFSQYPPYKASGEIDKASAVSIQLTNSSASIVTYAPLSRCHRGLYMETGECFCPPSYYGNQCQYQSDRMTVILQVDMPAAFYDRGTVFSFVISIHGTSIHEQVMHMFDQQMSMKHVVYLLMPVDKRTVTVRIDAFRVTFTSADHQCAWLFHVPFPFLPVNRLAVKLATSKSAPLVSCPIICVSGICLQYKNRFDYYCVCDKGWYGHACNLTTVEASIRVCPLGHFGIDCFAKQDPCRKHQCQNGARCIPMDPRTVRFVCLCDEPAYFGDRCQHLAAIARVRMPMQPHKEVEHILVVVVYFLDVDKSLDVILIQDRLIYKNVLFDSSINAIYAKRAFLSTFVLVQLCLNTDTLYGEYHLVGLSVTSRRNISTRILDSNYCPHIAQLLTSSQLAGPYIKRIRQYYHEICLVVGIRCFHDEDYICLCDNNARLKCFNFDRSDGNCTDRNLCQNGAYCVYARQKGPQLDFGCVCPRCFYGSLCQFTTSQYSISLDALIEHNSSLTLSLIMTMIFLALLINSFALILFTRKEVLQIGCGLYLLALTSISQVGLVIYAVKIIVLLQHWQSPATCILLEYLLSVLPSIFDWFTACVATERMFTVLRGILFDRSKSVKTAKILIPVVIILNFMSTLHEPFNRQLIENPGITKQFWCVMKITHSILNSYEIISNLAHLILPFFINLVTTVILIRNLINRKATSSLTSEADTYWYISKKELYAHKSFIISPLALLLFQLPRLILAFAFACMTKAWQKHVYLASYFAACTPYMATLFIYVTPSDMYKNELKASFAESLQRFRHLRR